MKTVKKVVAYITREKEGKKQLLVNVHRDYPEVGKQVPAGTVEKGEPILEALYREIEEESGLKKDILKLEKKIGEYNYFMELADQNHERHVFHLSLNTDLPDKWVHADPGAYKDRSIILDYFWLTLDHDIELDGGLGDLLHKI